MRAIFRALLLAFCALHLAQAFFSDMYGNVFQIDLLDDCSIYVYDRVLKSNGPKDWCLRPKASMSHVPYVYEDMYYIGIFCIYVDENNILQTDYIYHRGVVHSELLSQNFWEADVGNYSKVRENSDIKFTPTQNGKFYVRDYVMGLYFQIDYVSNLDYELFTRQLSYSVFDDIANVTIPDRMYNNLFYYSNDTKVMFNQYNMHAVTCEVGDTDYMVFPVKKTSISACSKYDQIKNFSVSFPQIFASEVPVKSDLSFAGMIETNGMLVSSDQKIYDRPPLENNYTEVPFFLYNSSSDSYSPLFLYYKFDGPSRDYTVRFVYNETTYTIVEPHQYMQECYFPDETDVSAAAKMLKHGQKSISFEVYLLVNNANYYYCVFHVEYDFVTKNTTTTRNDFQYINAYVHVQNRSKTLANCNFGNRTVRWLLAYTENKEAQLVSLDNDISSPIFPCSHCGNETLIYCDINPETASKYHSAVYLITGQELLYVRVKSEGYSEKIEYYNLKTEDKYYFLQALNITLSLDKLYNQLQGIDLGSSNDSDFSVPVNGNDSDVSVPVNGNDSDVNIPENDENSVACAPWMSSVLFLIFVTCKLF